MTSLKLSAGTRLSVDEFLDLDETDDKPILELVDGELVIMPRPRSPHLFSQDRIFIHIDDYIEAFEEPPADVWREMLTILSRESEQVVIPDVLVALRGGAGRMVRGYFEGAPDIVVEVLSTNQRHDLVTKRRLYAEAGVPEYWIFNPPNDSVTLLELRDGEYVERAVLGPDDTLTTPLLPGLAIPLGEIFHHRRRPPRDDE